MSENMQELKRRMRSIESTEHITNAMRLVSASKYKKAKNAFDKTSAQIREISQTMEKVMAAAANMIGEEENPGGEDEKEKSKTLIIAITGNRGLCGGFNANVIKQVVSAAEEKSQQEIEIYAIGSRGRDYFEHNGYEIVGECSEAPEKITFAEAREIARPLIEKFQRGEVSEIFLVHTAYINSLKQEPVVKKLLPLAENEFDPEARETEFTQEPQEILDYMVPKYFELVLFEAVTESAACEYAARRSAMESATDNANEILSKLSLTYNRVRQAAITNELIEIVSGAESQK